LRRFAETFSGREVPRSGIERLPLKPVLSFPLCIELAPHFSVQSTAESEGRPYFLAENNVSNSPLLKRRGGEQGDWSVKR
jgi:hypothetical protein